MKRHFYYNVALLFHLLPMLIHAQEHRWEVGVNVYTARHVVHLERLNINPLAEDIAMGFNQDRDSPRISVSGGIKAWYHFSRYFSIGTAVQFLSRGDALIYASIYWPAPPPNSKMSFISPIPNPQYYRQVARIYYFSFPILLKLIVPIKKYEINLEAGPSLDVFWREYYKTWIWGKYSEYYEGTGRGWNLWDTHNYSIYAGLTASREFAGKYRAEAGVMVNYGTSMSTKQTYLHQFPHAIGLNIGISRLL
jgi:hypothetical protein